MESPELVVTSVLFEPLHDPVQKSPAIRIFSEIRDVFYNVPDVAAWNEFMDSVRGLIPTPDNLLQL